MIPLQIQSHYSVLDSTIKPAEAVDIAVQMGAKAAALVDKSMAGIVQFVRAAKEKEIKPILGYSLLLDEGGYLVILAKNRAGFQNLLAIVSAANEYTETCNGEACLSLDALSKLDTNDLLFLDGHIDSALFNILYYEELVSEENQEQANKYLDKLLNSIDKDSLYLQFDKNTDFVHNAYVKWCLNRRIKNVKNGPIKHQADDEARYFYNVLRCKKYNYSLKSLPKNPYDLGPREQEEDGNNEAVANLIEEYDILAMPELPSFPKLENGETSDEKLRQLCRDGYQKKIKGTNKQKYVDRIKYELDILADRNLADYFLILWDLVEYAEKHNQLVGPGRGSAAGCLVSYLIGITKPDPIEYNLIFERFINPGRVNSMPDIDMDFPKHFREKLIQYVIDTYGADKVAQVATYQTFMGRAAIKEILRAEGTFSFSEINRITEVFYDKAKIADELEEMKKDGKEPSVILWALIHKRDKLEEYAYLDENEEIAGPLAKQFKAGIRFEGIKAAQSKHAAGIIVGKERLDSIVPMSYDSTSKNKIVGLEYEDAEQMSLVKFDLLGLSTLDRIMDMKE